MQRGFQGRRQRTTLRRLARQIRQQDPELARLLSPGGPGRVPALRFTSVTTAGYAAIGGVLLLAGLFLGVGSAVLWGTVAIAAAALRRRVGLRPLPARGRGGRGARDRRGSV